MSISPEIQEEIEALKVQGDHILRIPAQVNAMAYHMLNHFPHHAVLSLCIEYLATRTLTSLEHISHFPKAVLKTEPATFAYWDPEPLEHSANVDIMRNIQLERQQARRLFEFLLKDRTDLAGERGRTLRTNKKWLRCLA